MFNYINFRDDPLHQCWMTESDEPKPGLYVARAIIPDRCNDVPVRVINTLSEPMNLQSGMVMSDLTAVDALPHNLLTTEKDKPIMSELLREMVEQTDDSLSPTGNNCCNC